MLIKDGITDSVAMGVDSSAPIVQANSERPQHKHLGYCNGWYAPMIMKDGIYVKKYEDRVPQLVMDCTKLGHKLIEKNLDLTHHGYNTSVCCEICKYSYSVDSSD